MSTKHLNQYELAKRWTISQRTLERWRWKRKGPAFLKIGGRVAYELSAVEAFEQTHRQQPSTPVDGEAAK
ncbi:MAG: helix-turn-helix transcriptional regulator [Pseudorhodoplanes sp.]|uniref:helix-turn-helix transcriptional regulator n=1 Tax=Pseudorhodoplanes sp. TaxID=1934341 RepID=UPI003D0EC590